jgi:hypothetical protein
MPEPVRNRCGVGMGACMAVAIGILLTDPYGTCPIDGAKGVVSDLWTSFFFLFDLISPCDRAVRRIDDRLALTVQAHLFLVLLIGLVLRESGFVLGSAEDIFARYSTASCLELSRVHC